MLEIVEEYLLISDMKHDKFNLYTYIRPPCIYNYVKINS